MTTNDVVSELANKWLPFPPEKFFTEQRAPDIWFSDELPPTLQDEMRNPLVVQSKMMLRYQALQTLAHGERRAIMEAEQRRRRTANSRIGRRVKSSRH